MEREFNLMDALLIPIVVFMVINIVFAAYLPKIIRMLLLGAQLGLLLAMLITYLYAHFIIKPEIDKIKGGINEDTPGRPE